MKVGELCREPDGKPSSSRLVMLLGAAIYALIFSAWLTVTAGLFFGWWEWSRFAAAMTWGASFASLTFVPYLMNRHSKTKETR